MPQSINSQICAPSVLLSLFPILSSIPPFSMIFSHTVSTLHHVFSSLSSLSSLLFSSLSSLLYSSLLFFSYFFFLLFSSLLVLVPVQSHHFLFLTFPSPRHPEERRLICSPLPSSSPVFFGIFLVQGPTNSSHRVFAMHMTFGETCVKSV